MSSTDSLCPSAWAARRRVSTIGRGPYVSSRRGTAKLLRVSGLERIHGRLTRTHHGEHVGEWDSAGCPVVPGAVREVLKFSYQRPAARACIARPEEQLRGSRGVHRPCLD